MTVNALPPTIFVEEDIQVAHRLSELPGKCQNIHGHSMRIILRIPCPEGTNEAGIALLDGLPLDFGNAKETFRAHLKRWYDHHLLLNENDPWAQTFDLHDPIKDDPIDGNMLPGLIRTKGDPTVENIAGWIGMEMAKRFKTHIIIDVQETASNGVRRVVEYREDEQ